MKQKARGLAAMIPERRRQIASMGGVAVSRNGRHMAEIGRIGGLSISKDKKHMSAIGRKGGLAASKYVR